MRRTVLPAVSLFLALALGCGGGGSSEPVNSIKIESVTPAAPGENATFTITVSYDLQTADSAVIVHCYPSSYFGDRSGDSWMGCPASIADITVNRGQGTITISVTEAFTGTRDLCVTLIPNQDPNAVVSVASDVYTIPVP